ncbi:gluconokinase [Cellulophaga baltica]|uniref:gluconokinase n=1 Tax=Cellulophaga TaxID=104264 RepID=UPI001C07CBFB|nr:MULTISPECIES: gluconokinase [Cellulophaga]MBU2996042.1 gluconokinase [Cellulophaga baltica]MDO6767437.1 gluconokinase [Cellulophaga sp. 1_MG-2023]
MKTKGAIFYVMGVSGTGKSTIGKMLSEKLSLPFFDGDDYHPQGNIDKMANGHALNDDDRYEWLLKLNKIALENIEKGAVIVCSALKESYRDLLAQKLNNFYIISLEGDFELILNRINARENHFMPASLLKSQFDTFEKPKDSKQVISVDVALTPEEILSEILKELK